MLNAQPTQFSLNDAGEILYQPVVNNPVPGNPVARLTRGAGPLQPGVAVLDGAPDGEAAKGFLENWLKGHIVQVLEPLIALLDLGEGEDAPKDHVKTIIAQVFQAMGIVPREDLEALIAQLDADDRRILRAKRIKLGPVLVFQPDLNKPAAVRLRALLWSLYHDKPLPAPVPKDGIVSFTIDPAKVDKAFYQAVGYPVYGPRAIRIDMLDRVINAIYDSAEKGKFQAQHQMAEWLGCGIEDLYAVLGAMGHVKGEEPEKPEELKPEEKPPLAIFYLKKGKAFQQQAARKPYKKDDKPAKMKKEQGKGKGKRNKTTNREPKVMSAEAKTVEDSPFAVLAQLKDKSNAG